MEWIIVSLVVLAGALLLGFLWWALADLALATFDFSELFERWGRRDSERGARHGNDPRPPVAA